MKKKQIIISVVGIGLIAAVFTFMPKRHSSPTADTKAETYQESGDLAGLLYKEAGKMEKEGELPKARKTYQKILEKYPQSNLAQDVRSRLDDLNIKILFSPLPTEDSVFYTVKPGDTLSKIAGQFGTTVELIMKSNNLANSTIMPETRFKISSAKYSILVDKSQNILMLKADNRVMKTYKISTGANNCTPIGTYTIKNKLIDPTWYNAGAVVPPESPENILGSRWMGLDLPGYGLHGTTDETTIGTHITRGCVRMRNKEAEELYSIIPIGTKVVIID